MQFKNQKRASRRTSERIILGIDPGTHRIGYAILKLKNPRTLQILAYGTKELKTKSTQEEYLIFARKSILSLVQKYKPNLACVEELFFSKNVKTASSVLQARGVILLSFFEKKIPVIELSATQVKKGTTGSGKADKKEVKKALELILKLPKLKGLDDSWDAIAIAFVGARFLDSM